MTKIKTCPVCEKRALENYAPFCSLRCREVDLNRWFSDGYRIVGEEGEALPELLEAGDCAALERLFASNDE